MLGSHVCPGAAEAVKQSGRSDVKVTGLSLPSLCKPYVHDGVVESFVLWNTVDLGYLTVYASQALATGQASDPTSVVMAVERAQLAMQLASQIRTKAVEAAQDIFNTQV